MNPQHEVSASALRTLGFVKEDGIWYADLPEFISLGLGSRANLMMVDGADTFLDMLTNGGNRITLKISIQPFEGFYFRLRKIRSGLNKQLLKLIGHAPVDYGAYYQVAQLAGRQHHHQLWLCPVTEFVFGNYPEEMYASILVNQ